uniref:hypothetical protein n=1 Tax=Halorubrum amylolyticum TaxID=2508724 RepID=UPI0019D6DCE5
RSCRLVVNQQISQLSGAVPWEASPLTARRRSPVVLLVRVSVIETTNCGAGSAEPVKTAEINCTVTTVLLLEAEISILGSILVASSVSVCGFSVGLPVSVDVALRSGASHAVSKC